MQMIKHKKMRDKKQIQVSHQEGLLVTTLTKVGIEYCKPAQPWYFKRAITQLMGLPLFKFSPL
jgi:hypothetical protein